MTTTAALFTLGSDAATITAVLRRGLLRMLGPDAPALGCAILAACGAGRFATIKEGCKAMVRRRAMIEPDGRRTQLYEREIYPRYVALYDALKSVRDVR